MLDKQTIFVGCWGGGGGGVVGKEQQNMITHTSGSTFLGVFLLINEWTRAILFGLAC